MLSKKLANLGIETDFRCMPTEAGEVKLSHSVVYRFVEGVRSVYEQQQEELLTLQKKSIHQTESSARVFMDYVEAVRDADAAKLKVTALEEQIVAERKRCMTEAAAAK